MTILARARRSTPLLTILFCVGSFWFLLNFNSRAAAQSAVQPASPQPASTTGAEDKGTSEIASHDAAATFKVNVRMVLVRVVVRDSQGHAVGNLRKEDFQLFDNRKPQIISQFSIEQPGSLVARAQKTSENNAAEVPAEVPGEVPGVGERYIAYVFDDIHLKFGDLVQARNAADRRLGSLQPTDRVAIYSTSGLTRLDFTDDRAKLHQTLQLLQSRSVTGAGTTECPDISYYMADQIVNQHDPQALDVATQDAIDCAFPGSAVPGGAPGGSQSIAQQTGAQQLAASTALQVLTAGEAESRMTLGILKDVVRKISMMPGQRTVVFVSPGFITTEMENLYEDAIERALRSNVIVNTLDARGLYTVNALGDISKPPPTNPALVALKAQYEVAAASAGDEVLWILSEGTGGTSFRNNNDLDEGFRQTATAPEYFYVLGFSPQNLKLNGGFHKLKVSLNSQEKLTLQARSGYYAPKHVADPAEQEKQEIEDALFSQEEVHDLPVDLHTQFFKASDVEAKVSVLVHIDAKRLHFRKADGRNQNDLTIVSGLFDRNGTYISGSAKVLEMHLKDETLEHKLGSGVTVKSSFDVKPGSYLVRLVVRDEEGLIAAENGAIEIP